MGRQIFAAELSFDDAPPAIYQQLAGSDGIIKNHLQKLSLRADEVFLLNGSKRFTIYIVNNDIAPLTQFFASYPVKGFVQFYYNTEESVTHLFAVAGGLLSTIKGDHLILDQLEQAYHLAKTYNTIGITLDNLLREAIRNGKKIRTQTGIDKFSSTVVDTGIELLYNRLEGLHSKKFLIVGTGKIARLALKYLYNEGISNIRIVGNDKVTANQLAELYYVESVNIEDIHVHAMDADVIIGSTHYEVSLFPESFLAGIFDRRKLWFVLDFGMSRNLNRKMSDHKAVELYNLDDLKRLHKSPLDDFGGIEAAWKMVMKEAKAFLEVMAQLEFSPVLVAYWNRLKYMQNRELNLSLPKLNEDLSNADVNQIRAHAQKLMRSITADSSANIRVLANNTKAEDGKNLVRKVSSFDQVKVTISLN